jgi:hypothetical protein
MVAVIDSIVSAPGVYMPWREMVQICREEGVWSVVDGAHSIGQEVGIDLKKADPDFWVSVRLFDSGFYIRGNVGAELSQVVVCEAAMCCSLCPEEVCQLQRG